jgi:hypothetical protein
MFHRYLCFNRETLRNTLNSLRVSRQKNAFETFDHKTLKRLSVSMFQKCLPLKGESTARNTRSVLPLLGPFSRRAEACSAGALGRSA